MGGQPLFTQEEMVLLLRCYFRYRHMGFNANAPHVLALSNLLRHLTLHATEVRGRANFRNGPGIDAQLRTLAACDPQNTAKRWKQPSRLMRYCWELYAGRLDLLERDAEVVIARYYYKANN